MTPSRRKAAGLAILPAILVPVALPALRAAEAPDLVSGLVVGALFGVSGFILARLRFCPG